VAPLSPGTYLFRAEIAGFQPREVHALELAVAGRIDLDFQLRALNETLSSMASRTLPIPGSPYRVRFFGPDALAVDIPMLTPREDRSLLDATRSQLIDGAQIRDLPFFGRDVYTMLVTQPGSSSDASTARGLGLAVTGQRPSSSYFLLDGLEANQALLSGPLFAVFPEVIQEYRISTGNVSAEYGFSSGYVANAVTKTGTNGWHGIGWWNLRNESLNANEFQNNRQGLRRPRLREHQPGYQLGGPLRRDQYFLSSSLAFLRSEGENPPQRVNLPTLAVLRIAAPGSLARSLLERFPPPGLESGNQLAVPVELVAPLTLERWFTAQRFDGLSRAGTNRLMARLTFARIARPDFIWSPYRDFTSGLRQPALSFAASLTSSFRGQFANELRFGWNRDSVQWDRSHSEIPTLVDTSPENVLLPGSYAFYAFRQRNASAEIADQASWVFGRHIVRLGGNVILRRTSGLLAAGRDGRYGFPTIVDFAVDRPSRFSVMLDRASLPDLRIPRFDREYRRWQTSLFVQDSFRVSRRWTLNLGVRYEYFSPPVNAGPEKDGGLELGPGNGFPDMLRTASLTFPAPDNAIYRASRGDWSARFGFSHDLFGAARTVARGGWGIYYDRPFDNMWLAARNNNLTLATFDYQPGPGGYLSPDPLPRYSEHPVTAGFPPVALFERTRKTSYSMTHFFAVQHRFSEFWSLETASLGALGRRLFTTDLINRPFSLRSGQADPGNFERSYNPRLPIVAYRGLQGSSFYHALTALIRYRTGRGHFYLSYTWGHSIDNQSDPLAGDFFDLNFAAFSPAVANRGVATFSRQFDSRADRASSDFDQRHNLVFFSIWESPRAGQTPSWLRNWRVSQMAAFRSGFPFTAYAPGTPPDFGGVILNNRADFDGGSPEIRLPVSGGFRILDGAPFTVPPLGRLGSLGRNAFAGPGFFNVDVSLSRSFPLPRVRDSVRLTFRADTFNLLNHANLGQPDSLVTSPSFGVALYGRTGRDTGFPALAPFRETARQIQILLRLEF
jgi:hypothetical protein